MAIYAVTGDIRARGGLLVKIGYASSPVHARLRELEQAGKQAKLRVLCENSDGGLKDERRLRALLSARWHHGAWFVFPSADEAVALVRTLGDVEDEVLQRLYELPEPAVAPVPGALRVLGVQVRRSSGREQFVLLALLEGREAAPLADRVQLWWEVGKSQRLLASGNALDLRYAAEEEGLRLWARVAATSYARDVQLTVESGTSLLAELVGDGHVLHEVRLWAALDYV